MQDTVKMLKIHNVCNCRIRVLNFGDGSSLRVVVQKGEFGEH
jgi:hypothetical protein